MWILLALLTPAWGSGQSYSACLHTVEVVSVAETSEVRIAASTAIAASSSMKCAQPGDLLTADLSASDLTISAGDRLEVEVQTMVSYATPRPPPAENTGVTSRKWIVIRPTPAWPPDRTAAEANTPDAFACEKNDDCAVVELSCCVECGAKSWAVNTASADAIRDAWAEPNCYWTAPSAIKPGEKYDPMSGAEFRLRAYGAKRVANACEPVACPQITARCVKKTCQLE